MNILKKIYCRIFQTCFRIALPVLPYREPELIDGFKHVPEVLKKHHISHILLVTDPGVYKLGLTKPLEKQLLKSEISCTIYKDTVANPTSANIEEAKDLYLAHGCQALLAFGGGSSMDCAKAVGARLARPNKPLAKMEGILKIWHKLPLLIAVPTTAGTGSETTLAAVITDADTHHKYAINDFNLIPDYAVLEPSVTYGLPPQLTATTGMDALTHAIEAYIGRSTTKQTRAASIEAIQLIFDNLQTAYKNGNDKIPPKICYETWIRKELEYINNKIYIIIGAKSAKVFFPKENFNELIFKDNYINGKPAIVLPHPSPLNIKWFKDHPNFMNKRILEIRKIINDVLEEE